MCLSDTAEYWQDVKSHKHYTGRHFYHHPTYTCSHYNNVTLNIARTPYIKDINCFECKKQIEQGNVLGVLNEDAPEDYYLSKNAKKAYRKRKDFNEKHGTCSCGSVWTIRINSKTNEQFLGCSNYPKCKNTKTLSQ